MLNAYVNLRVELCVWRSIKLWLSSRRGEGRSLSVMCACGCSVHVRVYVFVSAGLHVVPQGLNWAAGRGVITYAPLTAHALITAGGCLWSTHTFSSLSTGALLLMLADIFLFPKHSSNLFFYMGHVAWLGSLVWFTVDCSHHKLWVNQRTQPAEHSVFTLLPRRQRTALIRI